MKERRKRAWLLLIFWIVGFICFSSFISYAQSSPDIIFTKQYIRSSGKPQVVKDTFTVLTTDSSYILRVQNGQNDNNRVSSGQVSINGKAIVLTEDFNQQIDVIEKSITLNVNNTIEIQLNSGPGSFIIVTIMVTENTVTATPSPSATPVPTVIGNVTVMGTVTDLNTGLSIEGALVSVGEISFVTESNGQYSFDLTGGYTGKVLNIKADHYAHFSKPLVDNTAIITRLDAALVPVDSVTIINPTLVNKVTTGDGVRVDFPDLSSLNIGENLMVSLTDFNISSDELLSVPGNFMGMDDGTITAIASEGMLDVKVVGETTGIEYDFKDMGFQFDITLPITGDPAIAPADIDMWWYDTSTGLWMKEGTAVKNGDVYIGKVSHFTTWNMDFKFINPVKIHGTIDDPADDIYDITLKGPGFVKQLSIQDKDLLIINMLPDVLVELTIVKRTTGLTNVLAFVTTPVSGDTVELGDLFSSQILPVVYNIKISQDGENVEFVWTDPNRTDFIGLHIEYNGSSVDIYKGTEYYLFQNLPAGSIVFSLTARYLVNGETVDSQTITRKVRVGDLALLSLNVDIPDYLSDIILQNYPAVGDWYKLYYAAGTDAIFTEYTGPILLPVQQMKIKIEIVSYELPYIEGDQNNTYYVPTPYWYKEDDYYDSYGEEVEIELDSDDSGEDVFTAYFYGCASAY